MNEMDDRTTYSLLTPRGTGAVAVIAVEGTHAKNILARFFRPRSETGEFQFDRPYYGDWVSKDDRPSEDLIVVFLDDLTIEIHCHGGEFAWKRIASDLESAGVVESDGELVGKNECEQIRVEANADLLLAQTAKCAGILIDQVEGALGRAFEEMDRLKSANDLAELKSLVNSVAPFSELGLHLTRPWKVVLVGRPNVGKSSLINRILGYDRAIVFDEPGTTRDVLTGKTAIQGWPVELTDTVGIRDAESRIELSGIRRTESLLDEADLIVQVIDASQPESVGSRSPASNELIVMNKIDLNPELKTDLGIVAVSAETAEGLDVLLDTIINRLVPDEPDIGQAVPFRKRHIDRLQSYLSE